VKKLFIIVILTCTVSLCYASSFPTDKDLGLLASSSSTPYHEFLYDALSDSFSLDWCETYLSEESRGQITAMYSSILSKCLGTPFVMSENKASQSDRYCIVVRFLNNDTLMSFYISPSPFAVEAVGNISD